MGTVPIYQSIITPLHQKRTESCNYVRTLQHLLQAQAAGSEDVWLVPHTEKPMRPVTTVRVVSPNSLRSVCNYLERSGYDHCNERVGIPTLACQWPLLHYYMEEVHICSAPCEYTDGEEVGETFGKESPMRRTGRLTAQNVAVKDTFWRPRRVE
ncbi:unnamed protein product [Allacma fusca]|uniref:Uncharacterized protein n=1 Tax=Allacma fusca TaxID=39272 RepID=A0A8J2LDS4_9HEXA|nr:unnamed protein product [Allacma fusca]